MSAQNVSQSPRSVRLEQLLNEADGDLRQYVSDVLLDAWAVYDKTDRRSKRTLRISTISVCISAAACIYTTVGLAIRVGWL